MILEEYCSYILSRERDLSEFSFPGTNVTIDKNELLTSMLNNLRGSGYRDYDSLLMSTLRCYVSKDHIAKNQKLDDNMEAILNNIRSRVEHIRELYNHINRSFPFSYERIFEILVYYLRLITNIVNSNKDKEVSYVTAEISPEAVLYILNHKLSLDGFDAAWEKNGWKVLSQDVRTFSASVLDYYIKYILLATYIRYCEIKDN